MTITKTLSYILLPMVAVGMLVLAVVHAVYSQLPEPKTAPPVAPASNPFGHSVAGTGFVEPSTESSTQAMITVGSQISGVVSHVDVHIGQEVKAGELLFALDNRQANAEWKIRQASLAASKAQLTKLEKQPRPEEIPALEAQIRANEADVRSRTDLRDRDRKLFATQSITALEMVATEQAVQQAQAQVEVGRANLALLKAGAWQPDKDIAAAAVELNQAQLDQAKTTLDLLQVRSPVDGTILQINVRPGEFVAASPTQSLIVMGDCDPLHVRVSIDEEDIPRLKLNAPAIAKLRGDLLQREIPIIYVRIEPYVIPKTSLTGVNTERVDTRVMQIIYAIDKENPLVLEKKVLVGQLLDVFIDVK